MGRIIDTLAVALVVVGLLTAGVHAGHHDSLHVTPQNESTMTVDDQAVTVTFLVNNTGDRPVQNATLTVTNISSDLKLESTSPVELDRLNASEERAVALQIYVPAETPEGNYTLQVAVQQGNKTLDNATGIVEVEYKQSDTTESNDGSKSGETDRTTTESGNESSGGGAAVGMASDDSCHDVLWFEICFDLQDIIDSISPW